MNLLFLFQHLQDVVGASTGVFHVQTTPKAQKRRNMWRPLGHLDLGALALNLNHYFYALAVEK